jgi:hypothetical protein
MADAVLTILECVGIFLGSFINGLTGFGGASQYFLFAWPTHVPAVM